MEEFSEFIDFCRISDRASSQNTNSPKRNLGLDISNKSTLIKHESISSQALILSKENAQIQLHSTEKYKAENHFLPGILDVIAIDILTYLDIKDLKSTAVVSKKWASLTNDLSLWERLFNQFTQGFLWQFLFENPEMSTYHSYFKIFGIVDITYENFEMFFTQLEKKFISQWPPLYQGRFRIIQTYFNGLKREEIKGKLSQTLELIKAIRKDTRHFFLDAFKKN